MKILTTKELILSAIFAAMTCVLALIAIPLPFTPVPITLHVMGVAMAGAILGKKLGFISQGVYMLLGAIGLPVFSGGRGGIGVILGPTGGYIIGFVIGAFVIGFLVENLSRYANGKKSEFFILFFSMIVGLAVIYIIGALQLKAVLGLTLPQAIAGGVTPFIASDFVKVSLGAFISYYVRNGLKKSNLMPTNNKVAA